MDDLVQRQAEMILTYLIHRYALIPEKYTERECFLTLTSSSSSFPSFPPSPFLSLHPSLCPSPSSFSFSLFSVLEIKLSVPHNGLGALPLSYSRGPGFSSASLWDALFPCPFSVHYALKMGFLTTQIFVLFFPMTPLGYFFQVSPCVPCIPFDYLRGLDYWIPSAFQLEKGLQ